MKVHWEHLSYICAFSLKQVDKLKAKGTIRPSTRDQTWLKCQVRPSDCTSYSGRPRLPPACLRYCIDHLGNKRTSKFHQKSGLPTTRLGSEDRNISPRGHYHISYHLNIQFKWRMTHRQKDVIHYKEILIFFEKLRINFWRSLEDMYYEIVVIEYARTVHTQLWMKTFPIIQTQWNNPNIIHTRNIM